MAVRVYYYQTGTQKVAWEFNQIVGNAGGHSFDAGSMTVYCDSQAGVGGAAALQFTNNVALTGITKIYVDWACTFNSDNSGVKLKFVTSALSSDYYTGTWARRTNELAINPTLTDKIQLYINDYTTDSATSITIYNVWGEKSGNGFSGVGDIKIF